MNEVLENVLFAIKTEGDPKIKSNLMVQIIPFVLGCLFIIVYRGAEYIFSPEKLKTEIQLAREQKYFLTSWRISHVFWHLIGGLLFQRSFWLGLLMGICWEILEHIASLINKDEWWGTTWENLEDIVANTAGFIIGFSLRKLLTRANSLGTVTG